jgi:pimeloyl-ACP methyl ester carboxylesterase
LLEHVRRGSGEPLLLVHGLGGERVIWEPVLDLLAAERDVIAVDMPGFGASPPLPDDVDPTPQALASSLGAFLGELGIERAHVAGNSLGAWVALELARQGRALSVTGLCSAGFWGRPLGPRPSPARAVGRVLAPLIGAVVQSGRARRALLAASVGHPERVPPRAAAQLVRAYVAAPAFERANAAMRAAVIDGVADLAVPVTLAWGELDRLVREPPGGVPGARRVVLHDCGHIPTWDDPPQVAGVLLDASGPAWARAAGRTMRT